MAYTCMTLAPGLHLVTYTYCCTDWALLLVVPYGKAPATAVRQLPCHYGCASNNLATERKVYRR